MRTSFGVGPIAVVLSLASVGPARGQTSWLGTTSSDWGTAANWTAGVPGPGVSANFNPVVNQTITLDANRFVGAMSFNSANPYLIDGASTLTLGGNLTQSGAGAVTISANISLGMVSRTLGGAGSGDITLNGALSNGTLFVNLSAASGTLTLGGIAANGSGVAVSNGVVRLNKPDGVTAATSLQVTTDTEAHILAGNQVNSIAFADGNGIVNLNGFSETVTTVTGATGGTGQLRLGSGSLTVGSGATSFLQGVEITGTGGSVIKQGNGLMILARPAGHSYTGGTTINAGVLDIRNTSGSATGTGPVQVNSGGQLRGSGIMSGSVTVADGGAIAAFEGSLFPRTLDFGSNLDLSATSGTFVSLRGLTPGDTDTSYSQINVGGAADLDGALTIFIPSTFDPIGGTYYILARGSGTGTFANRPEGAVVVFGGYQGTITYQANWAGSQEASTLFGGNDVAVYNVVPVPEPKAVLMIAFAGLAVWTARWFYVSFLAARGIGWVGNRQSFGGLQ